MTKHDVEIRRYLAWRRKVKGKSISIRLYEIVYVGLTMLWSKMEKPSLKTAIYKFIERKEYEEELMSGQLFRKLIKEIKENPSEDETGYYLSDSREELTHEDIKQIEKEKDSVIKELSTKNLVKRYETVLKLCKLYQSWALKKKSQQAEDVTRQESFEIYPYLPLKTGIPPFCNTYFSNLVFNSSVATPSFAISFVIERASATILPASRIISISRSDLQTITLSTPFPFRPQTSNVTLQVYPVQSLLFPHYSLFLSTHLFPHSNQSISLSVLYILVISLMLFPGSHPHADIVLNRIYHTHYYLPED